MRGEKHYFCVEGSTQEEIEPMQGEIQMNIRKFGNSEKNKFPFWVEGTFGDDI